MCCVTFFVKYILFAVNLVFVLAGIALVTTGIVVLVNITDILELIPVRVELIPWAVIVIGSIIFVIAFCGCCGAINENRCLIVLYAVTMLVLAALSTWLAVILFQNLSDLRSLVEGWLDDAFERQTVDNGPFQVLEVAFRCCGTTGPGAYGQRPLPPTCCSEVTSLPDSLPDTLPDTLPDNIPDWVPDTCTIIEVGCNTKLGDYFSLFTTPIAYGAIIIIIVQVVAMLAAFYLNSSITSKRNKQYV